RRGSRRRAEHRRDHERADPTTAPLLQGYVPQPGGQEPIAVAQIGGSGSEDLNVPGPPEPLVPLRAVGGYRDEVAAHTPHDVLVQTVHPRVGALEPAGAAHITTNDDGGDCFR